MLEVVKEYGIKSVRVEFKGIGVGKDVVRK